MRPTEHLRSICLDDWNAATKHIFCAELADGTLPLSKMKWYLAQDYQFIDQFVRLLASAIAHAPTLQDSVPAAQFLAVITGPENDYFQRSFDALEMTPDERNAPPAPSTIAFQNLMISARESGRYEEMLAVLCVAEWSYLSWATPFAPPQKDLPFWFAEWITLHAGEGFEEVVEYLRTQLDSAWNNLDDTARANVERAFANAVKLERDFFDASYAAIPT